MATDAGGRTIWNDKARSDLLQAIVDVAPPSTKEWEVIIAKLHAKGYTYNYSAALQHLQKLKKKNGAEAANGAASSPNKPGRPAACRVKKSENPGAARNKRKTIRNLDDRLDDDDEKIELKRTKVEDDPLIFDQYTKREPGLDDDGTI
ncbi:hypothetical protein F5X98DRAFT_234224 [Xylaria grammica]|nr:hypothetical protein F5X98DRAFT_234224 [Xylaria grammica]